MTTCIENGEIISIVERSRIPYANVAVEIDNVFEMVRVELTRKEFLELDSRIASDETKAAIVSRALAKRTI